MKPHLRILRSSQKGVVALLAAALLLGGCGPSESELTAQAVETSSAAAAVWTTTPTRRPTQTPTATLTPTPTASATLTATITPTEVPFPVYEWRSMMVDEVKKGPHLDLAVDSQDVPHIVYLDDLEDNLKFASLTEEGSWWRRDFESPNVDGFYPSIIINKIDDEETAHVLRWIIGVRWLAYMPLTQSGVTAFLPDLNITAATLALDSSKEPVPHLVYHDKDSGELVYARFRLSGWVKHTLAVVGPEGVRFPLLLDADDHPHLLYHNALEGLVYATLPDPAGEDWTTTVVDAGAGVGLYPSMVQDGDGQLHAVYYDSALPGLKYTRMGNSGWEEPQIIVEGESVGLYPSVGVDAAGNVQVAFFDASAGTLKHAVGLDRHWKVSEVEALDAMGPYCELVVGPTGNLHIAYQKAAERSIWYAFGVP